MNTFYELDGQILKRSEDLRAVRVETEKSWAHFSKAYNFYRYKGNSINESIIWAQQSKKIKLKKD